MIKRMLKDKKGEGYIDIVITVLCCVMLIVLAINIFSFLTLKQDLDYYAKEIITISTVNGKTQCSEITDRQTELTNETGLNPTVLYSADCVYPPDVPFGETVTVTLTYETTLKGFGVLNIPITLTVKHSGLSQVHSK